MARATDSEFPSPSHGCPSDPEYAPRCRTHAARASIMSDARAVPIARGPEEHAIHTVCTHWQAGTPSPLRLPGVIVAGAQ